MRTFELVYVPGLLQTEEYARAVLRTRVMATDEEISDLVAARMERQEILVRDKPAMLWVIVDESVLRRPVGGRRVMREQLTRLAGMSQLPNVVLQVVPISVGAYEGLRGPFVIADFNGQPGAVYLEPAAGGQIVYDADGIAAVTVVWDTIRAEALPRAASLALVEEAANSWT